MIGNDGKPVGREAIRAAVAVYNTESRGAKEFAAIPRALVIILDNLAVGKTTYVKGAEIYVRNAVRGAGVVAIAQQHLTCIFPAISGHTVVWESGPARRVLSHIHIYGARVR